MCRMTSFRSVRDHPSGGREEINGAGVGHRRLQCSLKDGRLEVYVQQGQRESSLMFGRNGRGYPCCNLTVILCYPVYPIIPFLMIFVIFHQAQPQAGTNLGALPLQLPMGLQTWSCGELKGSTSQTPSINHQRLFIPKLIFHNHVPQKKIC